MRRNAVLSAVLALVGLTFAAREAVAQGFAVYEHDACMMGRAGTGVAAPCSNAAAIFANPAGIVNRNAERKWNVSLGVTAIAPTFSYTDSLTGGGVTDAVSNTIPVPNFYAVRQLGKLGGRYPWAVGLGVFAPYGLISEWPSTSDFQGRFLGYYSELKSVYIQPTAAVQFSDWLSVGGGFDYIRSSVHLNQRADLAGLPTSSPGVTFGMLGIPKGTDVFNADLTGNSWSGTGHFGVLITTERVNIGIRYLMRGTADIQGDATFEQLPTGILLPAGSPLQPTTRAYCAGIADTLIAHAGLPLDDVLTCNATLQTVFGDQHASVPIRLPDQLIIGTSILATDKLRLLFDMQFTNWSVFQALALTFQQSAISRTLYEDYNNTIGLRFGAEYQFSPSFTVRGGGLMHQAAAPAQTVTPLLPEAERSEATLGASIRIGRNGQLDFAYQKIWQADRRGRVVEPPVRGPSGAAVNTGLYGGGANLFGANLVWRF